MEFQQFGTFGDGITQIASTHNPCACCEWPTVTTNATHCVRVRYGGCQSAALYSPQVRRKPQACFDTAVTSVPVFKSAYVQLLPFGTVFLPVVCFRFSIALDIFAAFAVMLRSNGFVVVLLCVICAYRTDGQPTKPIVVTTWTFSSATAAGRYSRECNAKTQSEKKLKKR